MLPQYVQVRDDHQGLETVGSGTWEDLAKAYRNQEAPPSSPSGHGHHYEVILCTFSAEVQLIGLGALSDALAVTAVLTAFQYVKKAEMLTYGRKSFFSPAWEWARWSNGGGEVRQPLSSPDLFSGNTNSELEQPVGFSLEYMPLGVKVNSLATSTLSSSSGSFESLGRTFLRQLR
ncbi:hypothetical protein MMC22_010599 [Lobaria immixta]|nr:hypothetical protein [Lobaria immixta]